MAPMAVLIGLLVGLAVIVHGFWYGWLQQKALMQGKPGKRERPTPAVAARPVAHPFANAPRPAADSTVSLPGPYQAPIGGGVGLVGPRPLPSSAVVSQDGRSYFVRVDGVFKRFTVEA